MLGVTERWVRSYRYGEPARVAAETYLRALDARRLLRAERRAALLQELHDIEAEANGDILDRAIPQAGMGEQRVLGRSGVVRGSRAPVADAGAVTP
ncbi:MAG TPA: hypothetical protein VNI56_03730 [Xanthomonadaceae bacterium]|nr:hypothetical protein [Xanthomonadaceae bacterium]